MIEVNQLSKKYGDRQAISELNFKIDKGDVVGFLGPNGAGKSTTMKIITGYMAPTSGFVKVCGFDVFENPIEVKKRIGYLPETPPLYLDMHVQDYLVYVARLKGVKEADIADYVLKALESTQLISVKNRLIKNLSKGFKQRVGIAQAIVSKPEVLVLDEPTVGLDPKQVAEIRDLINELRLQHTIILSTHILSEVQATCNKVVIINEGKIVAQENIEQIEKMNQGHILLTIRTLKSCDVQKVLESIEGVLSIDVIQANWFKIKLQQDEALVEVIAKSIISSGAGLLELSPVKANLEDVFLKLTYGQGLQQEGL